METFFFSPWSVGTIEILAGVRNLNDGSLLRVNLGPDLCCLCDHELVYDWITTHLLQSKHRNVTWYKHWERGVFVMGGIFVAMNKKKITLPHLNRTEGLVFRGMYALFGGVSTVS